MKTAAERQDFLVKNPPAYRHGDDLGAGQISLYWAWLLSGMFRLNKFEKPIFDGVRERYLRDQTTSVLNGAEGIVWG